MPYLAHFKQHNLPKHALILDKLIVFEEVTKLETCQIMMLHPIKCMLTHFTFNVFLCRCGVIHACFKCLSAKATFIPIESLTQTFPPMKHCIPCIWLSILVLLTPFVSKGSLSLTMKLTLDLYYEEKILKIRTIWNIISIQFL